MFSRQVVERLRSDRRTRSSALIRLVSTTFTSHTYGLLPPRIWIIERRYGAGRPLRMIIQRIVLRSVPDMLVQHGLTERIYRERLAIRPYRLAVLPRLWRRRVQAPMDAVAVLPPRQDR